MKKINQQSHTKRSGGERFGMHMFEVCVWVNKYGAKEPFLKNTFEMKNSPRVFFFKVGGNEVRQMSKKCKFHVHHT